MTAMSSTLEAPPQAVSRPRDITAEFMEAVAAARAGSDRRAVLRGVSWDDYLRIEDEREVRGIGGRFTYDDGLLEIEMESHKHGRLEFAAVRLIVAYMDENLIDYVGCGHFTMRSEVVKGSVQADGSFYIAGRLAVATKEEVDLAVDPPPDLAVEIDLSPPKLHKAGVYARLGVPEIWRWRDGRLAVNLRRDDGSYAEAAKSAALPDFPLEELAAELALVPHGDEAAHARDFRRRCRDRAA